MNRKLFKTSAILTAAVALTAFGEEQIPPRHSCEHAIVPGTENIIVPSGRDDEVQPEYREAVDEIFGPNGIARRLGLATPPHQIEFAPSGQLMALANLGRHPIGHWRDGSILATRAYGAAGVLEFVTPGCPTCRSFYSDTTSLEHQISILFHVAGHNDFGARSTFARIRNTDPILESLKLYELMEELYATVDHDEVSQWYQYLESLSYDQDMARGSFDDPSTFDPNNMPGVQSSAPPIAHARAQNGRPENPYHVRKHVERPSPSLLQAIVTNLPPTAPAWKRQMAKIYERMNRVYGFYVSNKIMNEGWATLMQEILAGHSKYATMHHDFAYADLLSGVAGRASFSNPYWLGRECWRIERAKFNAREEIRKLSPFERDKAFIAHAHRIIEEKDDYDFIRMTLDENWIAEHKLFLSRFANWHEWDPALPPSRDPNKNAQRVIVTRDAKRVRDYLAKKFGDKRFMTPRIFIEDFNAFGRAIISMRHDVVDNIPLERDSAAQRLYVQARMHERPVSLFTVAASTWMPPLPAENRPFGGGFGFGFWPRPAPPPRLTVSPIRIEVEPNGRVQAFNHPEGKPETLNAELTKDYQLAVDVYRDDQEMAVNRPLSEFEREKFLPAVETAVQNAIHSSRGLLNHSPTSARALLEYASMLELRLVRRIEMALAGKINVRQTKSGVRIRVLPQIPQFGFDREIQEQLLNELPPVTPDPPIGQLSQYLPLMSPFATVSIGSSVPFVDDGLDPDVGNGDSGDKYWGRPKDGGGDGTGREAGEGEMDPSEVEIPLDVYSKFLAEQIELPNLKPKDGESPMTDTLKEGGIHRPHGDMLYDRMTPMIIFHGKRALTEAGVPEEEQSPQDIFREGLRWVQPSDHIVRDVSEVPIPDMNAVVEINMDMSGSMASWIPMAKTLIFNMRLALLNKYKHIEFIFIGFDTRAIVFPDQETFFRNFLGGGTDYSVGFAKGSEEFERFPRARWDRYFVGIGDSDDNANSARAVEVLNEIYEKVEFAGYIHVGHWGRPDLIEPMKTMAQSLPYFRFVHVPDSDGEGDLEVLKKLFGKTKEAP